jgi:hypothetical protein
MRLKRSRESAPTGRALREDWIKPSFAGSTNEDLIEHAAIANWIDQRLPTVN